MQDELIDVLERISQSLHVLAWVELRRRKDELKRRRDELISEERQAEIRKKTKKGGKRK